MVRKKIYRTNKGKSIDMEAMRIANERTVAAGNMNVNARGDEIKGGKIVKSAKERVEPYYKAKKQTARTSLKPPIKRKDAQFNTPVEDDGEAVLDLEPIVKIRTRDDGSEYKEIFNPDGTIEHEDIVKTASKKTKKKTSKKKT